MLKLKFCNKGITAIEALISIGLVSAVVVTIYMSLTSTIKNIGHSKQQTGAIALANERMEIIRNMPYDQIGIVGGIVSGPINPDEEVLRNGFRYNIKTEVRYIDDSFDGIFPDDTVPNDYKQIQVKTEWTVLDQTRTVELFSDVVPEGIESDEGGGVLSINTITTLGEIVPDVSINIDSVEDNPSVNFNTSTDDQGNVVLPATQAQTYRITLTKSDYETVRTYPNTYFTPFDSDINVVESKLNSKTFFIDPSSDLTLKAVNVADSSGIEGITFEYVGGKKIGVEPDTFNLDGNDNTDSNGEINLDNISSGSYTITNEGSLGNSQYGFIFSDTLNPFQLNQGVEMTANYYFANREIDSLAITLKDAATENPIEGAEVRLAGGSFDQTAYTNASGNIYFPLGDNTIDAGNYDLSITATGYNSYDEEIYINDLVALNVSLTAN